MRIFAGVLSVMVVVLAAINLGSRIPPDTVAMAIGVALGALCSIPVSLALGALAGRRLQTAPVLDDGPDGYTYPQQFSRQSYGGQSYAGQMYNAQSYQSLPYASQPPYPLVGNGPSPVRDYPPVVIIDPAAFAGRMQPAPLAARMDQTALAGPRQFRIVGEDATA